MFNNKIDTFLIFGNENRFYFTKLHTSFGCVIINEKESIFITDFRYESVSIKSLPNFTVICTVASELYNVITRECKRMGSKNIGFEENVITVNEYKTIKSALSDYSLKPAGKIIENLRAVKTQDEIDLISASQQLAQKALLKVLPLIKVGITERELSAEIMFEVIRCGADTLAFNNIVAFGENTARPHHSPSNKKLEKNELILIDMGAKANGYCSDMTRTFCLGEPNNELAVIHNIVLAAQNYALKNIKAGMTGNEADSLAREYMKANGYDKEFGHALGHGVGIDIHEFPRLGINSEDILLPNMVVTVEPGIYIEGLGGIRIEDLIVIKEDGIVNLTNFNKNINL